MSSQEYTILYIEDDSANRQLVKFILQRRENIRLLQAETGTEGFRLAVEQQPDIILLDLSLPDISGFDVLKELQVDPDICSIPVIAVSGNSSPRDIEKGLSAGFIHYLEKPISISSLDAIIDETIAAML